MGFFEDVINTTKSAAATAGKKTDEAVRFTKLKIKESQTTGDIKSHFEKLGQMAYEMKKSDKKEFVEQLFDIGIFGDMHQAIHRDILDADKRILAM